MPERTTAARLVLASASAGRLRLLRSAGFDPDVVVSGVDEEGLDHLPPGERAVQLARAKAEVVAARHAGPALVVGADSLFELDGEVHGKPGDAARARERWRRMRGRDGVLHTGHALVDTATGRLAAGLASTRVWFAEVTDAEIDAYVASGEPLGVAGAFTLDGRAGPFVERVDGDPSNVVGLSLPLLRELLGELGVDVTSLWAPARPFAPQPHEP
jgi:septum formation protein